MKKLISLLLALVMVFALATVASADVDTTKDMQTITITKDYNLTNDGTISPLETFNFTIERTSVTDAAEGVTKENMPIPTIGSVEYAAGDAGSANMSKNITLTLPEYSSIGIYTYTVRETAGTTAGVTYYGDPITVVVTVQQMANGTIRVAAVHTEGKGEAKADNFPNEYSAGDLRVTKLVTGNMGDQTKEFNVTVEFTAPAGKDVNGTITYVDGTETKTIDPQWENGKATAVITLKHNESVIFTNIPYGVTYTVIEDDYTKDEAGKKNYDPAKYDYEDKFRGGRTGIIDSAAETATITNNKGVEVDTGIVLDSMPYVLLLAVAFFGMAMLTKKRRCEN